MSLQPHIHVLDNIILSEPSRYTLTDRRGVQGGTYRYPSKEASKESRWSTNDARSNDARSTERTLPEIVSCDIIAIAIPNSIQQHGQR